MNLLKKILLIPYCYTILLYITSFISGFVHFLLFSFIFIFIFVVRWGDNPRLFSVFSICFWGNVAGVSSFVFGVQSDETACLGGGSGSTRIDGNRDWIDEYLPAPPPIQEPADENNDGAAELANENPKFGLRGCSSLRGQVINT